MIGKVRLISRGPGGRVTKADAAWIRAMRKDHKNWALIRTYFEPMPSIKTLERIAAKRIA